VSRTMVAAVLMIRISRSTKGTRAFNSQDIGTDCVE
jgi:hypothetical protein